MNALANLSPTAQKAIFGVLAVVLVALAFFAARGPGDSEAPEAGGTSTVATDGAGTVVTNPETEDTAPAPSAADIEMPLNADEIAKTAALADKFATTYTTYRYNQNDAQVSGSLSAMLDKGADVNLTGVIPTGTFKAGLIKDRYSTDAKVTGTRAITVSTNLVAYEVDLTVTTHKAGATTTANSTYLVTLTNEAGWGVNNFDLSGTADQSSGD